MRSPKDMWERAKCRDHPLEELDDFYPDRNIDSYTPAATRAKAVCRGEDGLSVCPVLLECLALALLTGDGFGIWGGLSPRERNALRRSGDLNKYKAVQKLPPNPYREMIQEYLNDLSRVAGLEPDDPAEPEGSSELLLDSDGSLS